MKEIKSRESGKGSGILDRSSYLSERMKRGLIRSKDQVQNLSDDGQVTPEEYAEDKIKYASEDIAGEAACDTKEAVRKTYDGSKRLVQQIKEKRKSGDTIKQTEKSTGKQTFKTMNKNIKTAENSAGRAVKTSETAARTTIKTTEKTAKTAEQTARAAKKTAEATAKAAKKTAEATKKAAEATAKAAKATAKAVVTAVKAVAAGIKSLVAAIAAGGWVAVVIILLIVVVALIVGSGFGIFYSMEDSGTGMTVKDAVSQINAEYEERLDQIEDGSTYDKLVIDGDEAAWSDVLSVYSVKTTSDFENGQEVATMDLNKLGILRSVFWDMHIITNRTQEKEETEIVEIVGADGKVVKAERQVTRIYLYIYVQHKTPMEMAAAYGFSDGQKTQLSELIDPKNERMWSNILSGIIRQ